MYLANTSDARSGPDTWFLAPAHKRLGELYEAKGNPKKSAEHYATFIEMWKKADPDLQPKVAEAKVRLERVRAKAAGWKLAPSRCSMAAPREARPSDRH